MNSPNRPKNDVSNRLNDPSEGDINELRESAHQIINGLKQGDSNESKAHDFAYVYEYISYLFKDTSSKLHPDEFRWFNDCYYKHGAENTLISLASTTAAFILFNKVFKRSKVFSIISSCITGFTISGTLNLIIAKNCLISFILHPNLKHQKQFVLLLIQQIHPMI